MKANDRLRGPGDLLGWSAFYYGRCKSNSQSSRAHSANAVISPVAVTADCLPAVPAPCVDCVGGLAAVCHVTGLKKLD